MNIHKVIAILAGAGLTSAQKAIKEISAYQNNSAPFIHTELDVFGLVTVHTGSRVAHLRNVMVSSDGTLGIDEDAGSTLFQGVLLSDDDMIFQLDPILEFST